MAVASLLQRAFSIVGWPMQTEVIYGKESRARADLGYKHFGWWRFYEVKTGVLDLKTVAEEFEHFESNRCSLFKVCRTFTIYSHGFSDDAIIFANSHKQLTLQTFASLRNDSIAFACMPK